jgi:hypothetical protein
VFFIDTLNLWAKNARNENLLWLDRRRRNARRRKSARNPKASLPALGAECDEPQKPHVRSRACTALPYIFGGTARSSRTSRQEASTWLAESPCRFQTPASQRRDFDWPLSFSPNRSPHRPSPLETSLSGCASTSRSGVSLLLRTTSAPMARIHFPDFLSAARSIAMS